MDLLPSLLMTGSGAHQIHDVPRHTKLSITTNVACMYAVSHIDPFLRLFAPYTNPAMHMCRVYGSTCFHTLFPIPSPILTHMPSLLHGLVQYARATGGLEDADVLEAKLDEVVRGALADACGGAAPPMPHAELHAELEVSVCVWVGGGGRDMEHVHNVPR